MRSLLIRDILHPCKIFPVCTDAHDDLSTIVGREVIKKEPKVEMFKKQSNCFSILIRHATSPGWESNGPLDSNQFLGANNVQ